LPVTNTEIAVAARPIGISRRLKLNIFGRPVMRDGMSKGKITVLAAIIILNNSVQLYVFVEIFFLP